MSKLKRLAPGKPVPGSKKPPKPSSLSKGGVWLSPFKRFFLGGMLGALLLFFSWQIFQTIWENSLRPAMHQALAALGFRVEYVFVVGRHKTSQADILQKAQLTLGDSLFLESPEAIKNRLEALPWVQQACVERRLPHAIWIHLREKKPLALWQYEGVLKLIDQSGSVIPCAAQDVPSDFIKVVGEKAPQKAPAFLGKLSHFPDVKEKVVAAVCLRVGRWDLYLKNGWVVKLPEKKIEKALQQLLAFEQKQTLAVSKISALDLRFQGAFVLQFESEPIEKVKRPTLRVKGEKDV
ncbi:MAG: cell division protein FtsQ/DivIB [Alphaproteobacteria bacterium]